jgi:hypothetical protein
MFASLLAIELVCYHTLRSKTFHTKTFAVFLATISCCIIMLPLFVTGTTSYGAAETACYDRAFLRHTATNIYQGWSMDDNANWRLFPSHLFNCVATVVSLFAFGVWLFFSPHISDQGQNLDRKRTTPPCSITVSPSPPFIVRNPCLPRSTCCLVGSYFAVQLLANLIVACSSLSDSCPSNSTVNAVGFLLYIFGTFALSCVGTNLLCHRYLFEKARVMIKLYDCHFLLSCASSQACGLLCPFSSSNSTFHCYMLLTQLLNFTQYLCPPSTHTHTARKEIPYHLSLAIDLLHRTRRTAVSTMPTTHQ